MVMDDLVAKPETYGLRKGWSGGTMGMMTIVRVLGRALRQDRSAQGRARARKAGTMSARGLSFLMVLTASPASAQPQQPQPGPHTEAPLDARRPRTTGARAAADDQGRRGPARRGACAWRAGRRVVQPVRSALSATSSARASGPRGELGFFVEHRSYSAGSSGGPAPSKIAKWIARMRSSHCRVRASVSRCAPPSTTCSRSNNASRCRIASRARLGSRRRDRAALQRRRRRSS